MADLEGLLARTSRTFALSIPHLPEPTRQAVMLAYLLFRIADTFEDAAQWPRSVRHEALSTFHGWLTDPALVETGRLPPGIALAANAWADAGPTDHAGYLDLLRGTEAVFAAAAALPAPHRARVLYHAARTTEGMRGFVDASTARGDLHLADLDALKQYCYIVAGIVGELLTDLFLLDAPLAAAAETLQTHARAFGEGLQLVNILKDADDDARDGRVYLPPSVPRASILTLARRDLTEAQTYVLALQGAGAPRGFVAFTALPVLLARHTLDLLERDGAGAKLPRSEVVALALALEARLDQAQAALTD